MNDMYPDYQIMPENQMKSYLMGYENLASSGYPVAGYYMNQHLVKTIQDCEVTCEHMTFHLQKLQDFQMRAQQALLLRDCADICGLAAKFAARGSMFTRQTAALCACICEVCGQECARFPDQMSQHCARVCMYYARECRAFAGAM
jgi:hypothetical protein